MMRDLRTLFKTAGGGRRYVCLLLLRCPFDALHTVILATFLQYGFQAINLANKTRLYWVCAAFGLASLLLFLYNGCVWRVFATFVIRLVARLRKAVFGHVAGLSLRQIEAQPCGEWFTHLNADVQSASALLSQPLHLPHAVVAIVGIAASSIFLLRTDATIFALVIAFMVPHILISQLVVARPITRLATLSQQATACNSADLDTLIVCADTAILYDARAFLLDRFKQSSLRLRKANMRVTARKTAGAALLPMLGMSGYLVILLMGGLWIAAGRMTFGELTAAFQYRGGVLMGCMVLVGSLLNIKSALAGVRRVNETMRIQSEE